MRLQQRAPKCNVLCSPLMRLQLRYTTVHRPDAVLESFLSPFILRFPYSARLSSYLGFVQNRDGGWGKKEEKARTQNTQKSDFNWTTILVEQAPWSRINFWLIDPVWPTISKHHVVNHSTFVKRLTVRWRCVLAPGSCKEQKAPHPFRQASLQTARFATFFALFNLPVAV